MEKNRKNRNHYDRSFKEAAVKLSYERKNLSAVARELGVDAKLLRRWRVEYEQFKEASFQGHGTARLTDEQKEIHRLKKELDKRTLELEILKKALGIISTSDR
jgi:transposase